MVPRTGGMRCALPVPECAAFDGAIATSRQCEEVDSRSKLL